jgi:predicted transcriptional regulator
MGLSVNAGAKKSAMKHRRTYSLRARDIMNRNVGMILPLASIQEAVDEMATCDCHALIVDRVDDNDTYGVITYQEIINEKCFKEEVNEFRLDK